MNTRRRMPAAKLWLAAGFVVACTTLVNAQLSTSLAGGGTLSAPLDSDLSGLDSTVAPVPSGTIEPGANNLLNPDSHLLPFDAIGASIDATPMSPSATQFYPLLLSRSAYQLDSELKDVTRLTGLHTQIPANIVDIITRKPEWLGSSPLASSSTQASISSNASLLARFSSGSRVTKWLPEMRGNLSGTTGQQSYGGVSATSAVMLNSPQPPQGIVGPQQGHSVGNPNSAVNPNDGNDLPRSLPLSKEAKLKSSRPGMGSQPAARSLGDNTSPLETPSYGNLPTMTAAESPFENLSEGNFFNPDITRITSVRSRREKGVGTLSESRSQSEGFLVPRSGSSVGGMKNREISPDTSRLMKLSSRRKVEKGPKWHNPILQQMEAGNNLDQESPRNY